MKALRLLTSTTLGPIIATVLILLYSVLLILTWIRGVYIPIWFTVVVYGTYVIGLPLNNWLDERKARKL